MTSRETEADKETAKFSPSSTLDEVWHLMLLRPRLYAAVCRSLGVKELIDHDPRLALDGHASRLKATIKAYKSVYGVCPPYIWREKLEEEKESAGGRSGGCSASAAPSGKRRRTEVGGAASAEPRDGCGPPPQQHTLSYYNIGRESTLHLVLKLGGC